MRGRRGRHAGDHQGPVRKLLATTALVKGGKATGALHLPTMLGGPLGQAGVYEFASSVLVLVLVLVWDAVAGAPVRREAGSGDESGRGLAIVAALSARWDFYRPPAPFAGKVTWALVDMP